MHHSTSISARRAIAQENHTREVMGDVVPFRRSEIEDDLVDAVYQSVMGQNPRLFRAFLRKYARDMGWDEADYTLCMHDDNYCWVRIWSIGVYLRRLMPIYEHCANQLIWGRHCHPYDIPPGTEFLGA